MAWLNAVFLTICISYSFVKHYLTWDQTKTCPYNLQYSLIFLFVLFVQLPVLDILIRCDVKPKVMKVWMAFVFLFMIIGQYWLLTICIILLATSKENCTPMFVPDFIMALTFLILTCLIYLCLGLLIWKILKSNRMASSIRRGLKERLKKLQTDKELENLKWVLENVPILKIYQWDQELMAYLADNCSITYSRSSVKTDTATGAAIPNSESQPINQANNIQNTDANLVYDDEEGDTCPICLDNFNEGEKVIAHPKCGHLYHKDCLEGWLIPKGNAWNVTSANKCGCPTCRCLTLVELFVEMNLRNNCKHWGILSQDRQTGAGSGTNSIMSQGTGSLPNSETSNAQTSSGTPVVRNVQDFDSIRRALQAKPNSLKNLSQFSEMESVIQQIRQRSKAQDST